MPILSVSMPRSFAPVPLQNEPATGTQSLRDATFRAECLRAISSGILETASATFLLLIAVRFFNADATAKALVAAAGSSGMIISPGIVTFFSHRGTRPTKAAAFLNIVGGLSLLVCTAFPSLPIFLAGSLFSMIAVTCGIPLVTQVLQDNYPAAERGRLFSRAFMIRIVVAAGFSQVAGWLLADASGRITLLQVRGLLLAFALALFFGAWCFGRCPSRPLAAASSRHPLQALRYLGEDAVFRRASISWMLMGFANLMMLPMRVEYLANPRFGLTLSVAMIAFLTGVIPNLARLVMSPVWGNLFDRLNFFLLRVVINAGFAIGILAFFTGNSIAGLVVGSLVFGISNAGGDVAWSLWVTKVAAPERVADYMSVHTFLTGIRGMAAPFAAFYLVKTYPPAVLGWFSAALIGVSCLVILPELKWQPGIRRQNNEPIAPPDPELPS